MPGNNIRHHCLGRYIRVLFRAERQKKKSTLRLEFDRLDRYGSDVTNVRRRVPLDPVRTGGRKRVFTPGGCMSKNATTKGGFFYA